MIDRKKLLFRSLIPILACTLLGGIGFTANAQTAQSTTQTQTAPQTAAQKRAAKRAAKKQAKEDQKAAANSAAPATTSTATKTAPRTETKTGTRTTAMNGGPSSSDIASAKAKGLVWVNTGSKVYHTGGRYYGTTKHGKFMTQTEAQRDGYTASKR